MARRLGIALLASVASGTTGGLIGALTAHGFHDGYALAIERQIENGGLILWISPRDDQQRQLAKTELEAISKSKTLSRDARDIVTRMLA